MPPAPHCGGPIPAACRIRRPGQATRGNIGTRRRRSRRIAIHGNGRPHDSAAVSLSRNMRVAASRASSGPLAVPGMAALLSSRRIALPACPSRRGFSSHTGSVSAGSCEKTAQSVPKRSQHVRLGRTGGGGPNLDNLWRCSSFRGESQLGHTLYTVQSCRAARCVGATNRTGPGSPAARILCRSGFMAGQGRFYTICGTTWRGGSASPRAGTSRT